MSAPVQTFDDFVKQVIERFGGSIREPQMEMIKHVLTSFAEDAPICVEAPVGSGKSFAYVLCAVIVAKSQNKRVLITTRTKKLQDQLARDMPRYMDAILGDKADTVTWTVLKGRNHFTCKKRIAGSNAIPLSLASWATTVGGSRNDAPEHTDSDWWQVSGGQDCIGKKCPFFSDCPGTQQRMAAQEAHIIIANQTLLAMDIVSGKLETEFGAIPGICDIVIVDEAHHFTTTVREQLANDLKPSDLAKATFANAADLVQAMLPAQGYEFHEGILPGQELYRVYGNALQEAKKIAMDIEENEEPDLEDKRMFNLLVKIVKTLQAFATPEDNVLWIDKDGMHSSPIDIKNMITEALGAKAVLFTSATLADDFNLEKDIVKISGGYTNAGLYVANHNGSGKYVWRPDAAAESLELIKAIGGRTLFLFTSEVAMMDMFWYLKRNLDVNVYHQKLPDAIDKFRREETSVLLGLETCYEGIDAPGSTLSLVIMDRLPFPNMGDPLYQADVNRLGWFEASMPPTQTLFRQGVGRLLRGPSDIGVIVLLDNRLMQKGYGTKLRNSIQAQTIPDKETALAFLRQIREEIEK
jgi:ATP-dependent DNA helicase DinG